MTDFCFKLIVAKWCHTVSQIFGSGNMMTSSNGNIFRVTGHLCGEFTGDQWIPRANGQWRGALIFSLTCAWINGWVNTCETGDLRHHNAHYDVTVMNGLVTDSTKPLPDLLLNHQWDLFEYISFLFSFALWSIVNKFQNKINKFSLIDAFENICKMPYILVI